MNMRVGSWICLAMCSCLAVLTVAARPPSAGLTVPRGLHPLEVDVRPSLTREYDRLINEIRWCDTNSAAYPRLRREALRPEALILPTDKTPVDVILRRTRALLEHIKHLYREPLSAETAALDQCQAERASVGSESNLFALFCRVGAVRRTIAFRNPLLDFDCLVFLTHHKQGRGEVHMVDQYLGFNAKAGGGLYILSQPFSAHPQVESPLADIPVESGRMAGKPLSKGSFISLELDYEARQVWFAWTEASAAVPGDGAWDQRGWSRAEMFSLSKGYHHYHWRPDSTYHIFRAELGGTPRISQLTDGPCNDYDPCVLPSGRLVFISERIGGNQRCGLRYAPTATLHAMMPDGSDIIPLSYHDTNEWQPSVNHDGMLVYTRWDYIDRDSDIAHHLWTCFPDGRNPRSAHGNYPDRREARPWMELSIRAIPGSSSKYVAVAAPHHGQAYGSLVLIDTALDDDHAMSQIRRITPEAHFPESESAPAVPCRPKGIHKVKGEFFGSPWPLSEDFYLCVYDPGQKDYGIYLVDSFGNRVLVCNSPDGVPCLDPIPLRPRTRPPVIPVATRQAAADRPAGERPSGEGTVSIANIYESDQHWPPGTKITSLRIINLFPKDNAFMDEPRIGVADQSLARGVLGTVPVEADGSAYFRLPAGVPVYFQALDARGRAIQSMRSETYLHTGEHMSCLGCHESKLKSRGAGIIPQAMRRAPSVPKPETPGAYPLTFPRLVQPVLDRNCVACHDRSEKAPDLSGLSSVTSWDRRAGCKKPVQPQRLLKEGYSNGFQALEKHAWSKSGGNGALIAKHDTSYSVPGQVGALASRLYPLLEKGHHDVRLTDDDWRRLILWLDCNSNFYGAYHDTETQAKGGIVMPQLGLPAVIPSCLTQ